MFEFPDILAQTCQLLPPSFDTEMHHVMFVYSLIIISEAILSQKHRAAVKQESKHCCNSIT